MRVRVEGYVSTVGLNEETIRKYIREQEKHDIALDKLSVKEYEIRTYSPERTTRLMGGSDSEKTEAGNAILEACKAMTNPDPIPLGEYRGFTMELYFEAREYKVRLKGELGYPVTLGTDTFGNITRLDNAPEGLPKRLEMNEMELDNIKKQFETAKVDVERPFPQEEELKAKTDRLNELNALLNVDKRENEIVGGEPDEGEEPPEKKPRDLER